MTDVFEVANLLVSHALKTHAQDVDIIAYYGSHAQGVAAEESDFDIFYVPAEGIDPPIGRTFLLEGILFDFWAIRWETLEGFATGRVRGWAFGPALVHHAKLLHARSEQPAARLAELKQRILDLQKPEARPQMVRRALETFRIVMTQIGNLRLAGADGDFADVRHAGWKVILSAWECLALAHQVFFNRGPSASITELPKLRNRPAGMDQLIRTISTSSDPTEILSAAEQLALGTRQVLRHFQESLSSLTKSGERLQVNYPEIRDGMRKVLSACESGEPVGAGFAAWLLQSDLSFILAESGNRACDKEFNLYREFAPVYRDFAFPDLMQCSPEDLVWLAEQTRVLDQRIRKWFSERSVSMHEYSTLENLRRSL